MSKIAQGRQSLELGATPNQEKSMRIRGLECLIGDLYVNPSVPSEQQMPSEPPEPPLETTKNNQVPPYGSAGSLSSANSSLIGNKEVPDSPEQYEVQKHQKEIWETGIEM